MTVAAEWGARVNAALDLLAPSSTIALAVSGGPDSLALLLLAHEARPGGVIAATVDHGLRAEAADEARMVAGVCAGLDIPHDILTVDVPHDPAGLQAAARAARYNALGSWCVESGARFLATAHHLDDQAETLLMRLARGAGLAGLSSVRRSRALDGAAGVTLIRPLLDWRKGELEAVVAAAGLNPVRDPSNADARFDRTRARALLAGGWPSPQRVAASADWLAEAEDALAWSAARLADERLVLTDDSARIDVAGLPREHRRRLLVAACAALAPEAVLRGDSIHRLLCALDAGDVGTLAGLRCDPGPPWRLVHAPPRRSV